MKWVAKNESPIGYEPIYSVVEKKTGRNIATDLEREEAHKIARSEEMFEMLCNSREMLEELFLYYRKENSKPEFLKSVNMMIAKIDILKNEIVRGK